MAAARDDALPKKLWCHTAEHWEVQEKFSKNQKAIFHNALRRARQPLNNPAIKALKMVCQLHSGQPVTEFKCHGPCSLFKHRDKFSKSQRRNKLRWCIECCEWRKRIDFDEVPVAHPNEDLSQAGVEDHPSGAQNEKALLEQYPFGYEKDDGTRDDDFDGDDDMDSDVDDDDIIDASVVFNGWSDDDGDDYDDDEVYVKVLPAKSVAPGKSNSSGIDQRLGNLSLRTPSSNATTRRPSKQASVTTRHMSSSQQSTSSITNSRTAQVEVPTFAGCTPGFVPPHLRAARAGHGGYASLSGTASVISSDSRAGITNASVYTSQASRDPTASGSLRQASAGATSQTSVSGDPARRQRPDRNGWARPDMRRNFDKQMHFATTSADYVETHESGSEDEI
ncbi:hypothetical protein PG999_002612 [Apiospora kogelbergensis]|uniref:Stc1 domain-containing protein n=1 Tax=Apiospora kogelbergensis TaxID=1337665 RepID=A0AAW0R8N1_9PEZI